MAVTNQQIAGVLIRPLYRHADSRGWLVELYRQDELPDDLLPVMSFVSQTEPGVTRGPREHRSQTACFCFMGPGDFELTLWDARPTSPTTGAQARIMCGAANALCIIVPPGVVHAYRNVSDAPGWVFHAPNQLYAGAGKKTDVDEIRHEDQVDSPYRLDYQPIPGAKAA